MRKVEEIKHYISHKVKHYEETSQHAERLEKEALKMGIAPQVTQPISDIKKEADHYLSLLNKLSKFIGE